MSAYGSSFSAARARVLFADDDPVLNEIAVERLNHCGWEGTGARDGLEAWELAQKGGFDLIVTDLNMPRLDGFGLLSRLKSNGATSEIPVIVVTGKDDAAAIDQAFEAGADSFLAKPLNATLFTESVRFVLRSAQAQAQLKAARAEALEAKRRAESAAHYRQLLISTLSHELRTPLNSVMGFAQILSMHLKTAGLQAQVRYAEQIIESGNGLMQALNDIMLISELRTDGRELSLVTRDARAVGRDALADAAKYAGSSSVRLEADPHSEPVWAVFDAWLVRRAVGELLRNALKFSPEDGRVRFWVEQDGEHGARFVVRDEGQGIDLAEAGRLCEPFMQGDMSLTRHAEGMGLGLAMVKAVADSHHGQVSFASPAEGGFEASLSVGGGVVALAPVRRVATTGASA